MRPPGADGGVPEEDGAVPVTEADATPAPDARPSAEVPLSMDVKIIVVPQSNDQPLIDAIAAAKTSVHVIMYLFTSTRVQNALVSAKQKGRDVKVILNQTFPGGSGSNQNMFNTLKNAGIQVVWAPSGFTLTHAKTVIIDATTAWIMTMNTTQTSPTDNREFLAVDSEPVDVAEAEDIFDADFNNQSHQLKGNLVVSPINSLARLTALIETATTSVDLEGEELSDTSIVKALIARADAGVKVRCVLPDATRTPAQEAAVTMLKAHMVPLVTVSKPYIHSKAIVVDGVRAYVGSENFTTASLIYNREIGVIFGDPAEVMKVTSTIAKDFAAGKTL